MSLPDFPAPGRTRVHGRIHARALLVAPLSGRRCVAYRVWGRIGEEIDQSAGVPFDMMLTGGRRARLHGRATLAVDFHRGDGELRYRSAFFHPWAIPLFGRVYRSGRLPKRLWEMLAQAGVAEPGAGVLHELTLEPGMGALVEGRLEEPRPGGYRDALPVHTIAETDDGAPVVIRSRDAPPGT